MKKGLAWGFVFVFGLLVSLVWHFPASWVVAHPKVQQQLPPALTLSQVEGPWWRGSSQVAMRYQNQPLALGKVRWQLDWWALLAATPTVDLAWRQDKQKFKLRVAQSGDHLHIENAGGVLNLGFIAQFIPNVGALLGDAKGSVVVKSVQVSANVNQPIPWPEKISGEIKLSDVKAMGATVDSVVIQPSMKDNALLLSIKGGGQGWQLSGNSLLQSNRTQQTKLTIRAESKNTMPSWVALVMPMKSDTLAESNQSGVW